MLNNSFTVNFRNVTEFVTIIAHVSYSNDFPKVFAFPSVVYGRKDGKHTIRVKAVTGYKTETLGRGYTKFIGIRADGSSVNLHEAPLSTYAGQVDFARRDGGATGNSVIPGVRRLRDAVLAETGEPCSLADAVDAFNVIRHELGTVHVSTRPLRLP